MLVNDPIADMLTRIRNALVAKHDSILVPASNEKKALAKILLDEGFITNVVVHPAYRRPGIATALLAELETYGKAHDLTRITLEVRASNQKAIALYEQMGYEKEGVRPGFYDSPKEDALIYSLYL